MPFPLLVLLALGGRAAAAPAPFDLSRLREGWRRRVEELRPAAIPLIDIESSGNPADMDEAVFARRLDALGVAMVALSPERSRDRARDVVRDDPSWAWLAADPLRFIPVTAGGGAPPWPNEPLKTLSEILEVDGPLHYPLLGEFEFRHYPSVRHVKHHQLFRDVTVPIDGPAGEALFEYSERTGTPFEIHYEIEDGLLAPLEAMLRKHPKAKVIWCHFAHIRYQERSTIYSPAYVRRLIETYPNLHFDLAVASPEAVYPLSGEKYARIWDPKTGALDPEWRQVIVDHPWRFHSALDLGGDRIGELEKRVARQRALLDQLPAETREIVAFKATWKLLFDEDFDPPLVSTRPLTVGYFLGGRTSMLMRLQEFGDFSREGVRVRLLTRKLRDDRYHVLEHALLEADKENMESKATGTELTQGVLDGRWDLATIGESSFLAAAAAGRPIVAVAELGHDVRGASGHLFAVRKGVSLSSPADYRGRLFVSRRAGPGDAAFLLEYLARQGVDLDRDVLELPSLPKTPAERAALPKDKVLVVTGVYEDDLTRGVLDGIVDGGFFHLKPFEALRRYLVAVAPLERWADPELSQAVLVCRKDFLERPENRARVEALLRAYVRRARYERTLPQERRHLREKEHWLSLDSATPGFNYPQYDPVPAVSTTTLEAMADLLRRRRRVDWKADLALDAHVDNSLVARAAASIDKETSRP